jgi:hypothetical protein
VRLAQLLVVRERARRLLAIQSALTRRHDASRLGAREDRRRGYRRNDRSRPRVGGARRACLCARVGRGVQSAIDRWRARSGPRHGEAGLNGLRARQQVRARTECTRMSRLCNVAYRWRKPTRGGGVGAALRTSAFCALGASRSPFRGLTRGCRSSWRHAAACGSR